MATITTIAAGDLISNSRADINTNFSNLNTDKIETSVIDTDTALTANSDSKLASQKATKAYVDSKLGVVSFSTTKVVNGTGGPGSFTDLDLSAVVGATKQRVVLLRVSNTDGTAQTLWFRRNGDTLDHSLGAGADALGANSCKLAASGGSAYVVVSTDSAGVIEWKGSGGLATDIWVEAYW